VKWNSRVRLVVIDGKHYSIYEGRRLLARFKADSHLEAGWIEALRVAPERELVAPEPEPA
jgi:hypothetical protein